MDDEKLKPNGCTLFPEGDYTSCCDEHDYDYILGVNRKVADKRLKDCITEQGRPILAWIVYFSVRIFGSYFWHRAHHIRNSDNPNEWWVKDAILKRIKRSE